MDHGQENITVVDENGNEQLCNVLFTFESEEFGKLSLPEKIIKAFLFNS